MSESYTETQEKESETEQNLSVKRGKWAHPKEIEEEYKLRELRAGCGGPALGFAW